MFKELCKALSKNVLSYFGPFCVRVAAKFGITGVPSLILFYNGRPVAKFNRSRTLQGLDDFVTQSTGNFNITL